MSAGRPGKDRYEEGWPLDATARDALERLVRIIHRCGFSSAGIEQVVRQAVRELPNRSREVSAEREMPSAPHVLTIWHDDPRYAGADGAPRPLARRGRTPSFQALVTSVDRTLDPDQVLRYLMRAGAVKEHGGKLLAVKRVVILRGISGPGDFRNLRSVQAMLRTAEHNAMPADIAPGWLERMAENANFPTKELPRFDRFLERETMGYLGRLDVYMRNAEVERKEGEPTVRLGVGMYRFQEEPASETPAHAPASDVKTHRRRRR